ncbi:MAG: hypothetical protein KGK01_10775 [Bradyrhizobium sp.]|uniref:hypothetical protein n=1 Tax=Bradyrhizobium sp. TaxID=376 RepID=UPI001C283386|nr:hypothetical protein [Bradyrhizobium sp.]MBU6462689.1 hypothetical protein [Pseudomonadota bacterium]MDE2067823.1 hypothetical protein [Bradyrhizobium sp.]MDE2242897.1 hypothetical protein [Bradyrhizobium sp.]
MTRFLCANRHPLRSKTLQGVDTEPPIEITALSDDPQRLGVEKIGCRRRAKRRTGYPFFGAGGRRMVRTQSFLNLIAKIDAIHVRPGIGHRKFDQAAARGDRIQADRNQDVGRDRFVLAKSKQPEAEIAEGALRLSDVSQGLIVIAYLLRADRQLPRLGERDTFGHGHLPKNLAPKLKERPQWLAQQFRSEPAEGCGGRDRNQIHIPLHVAAEPRLKFRADPL